MALTRDQFAKLPGRVRNRIIKFSMGRNTGPQWFATLSPTFAAPTQLQPNRPLQFSLPLVSIQLVLRARVTIAGASYTTGIPEAPQTLIDRITVQGTHKRYGNQTPINISGATAFAWQRLYQSTGNDLIIGSTRSADPGMPFVQTAGITGGLIGAYDIMVGYDIPVHPFMGSGQTAKREALPFLWDPKDWNNDLTLTCYMGDQTSLGTPAGGTTVTFGGFGGSGAPTLEVFLNQSMFGDLRNVMSQPGLVIRSEQIVAPALTGVASNQLLNTPGLAKSVTSNLLVKTGLVLTGTSGGVNVFSALSDEQLDATSVYVDNKPIRDVLRNYAVKNYMGSAFNTVQPQGYLLTSFVEGGSVFTAFRGDTVPGSAFFGMRTDVLTASANNRQQFVQEIILGGPFK